MEGIILRRFSLLALPVIAMLLSTAAAEPYQFGNTLNDQQQNVSHQSLTQLRPLPPVEPAALVSQSVEPIPAMLESSTYDSPIILASFDDPLMNPGDQEFDPLGPEMAEFIAKNSWKKGEFSFTPYGYLQADIIYETNPSTRTDYILFANQQTHGDRPQFGIDAKSSRLGMIATGPKACFLGQQWETAGQVEINFQGQFQYYNKPGVLFRRGFIEMKNSRWRFLGGQEWDVISPLNPGTLNYAAGFLVGNLNYRRPQFRVERTFDHSCNFMSKAQFSVNQSTRIDGSKSTSDDVVEYDSKWPVLEGRYSWTIGQRKGKCARPVVVGISGHVGQENYDFDFAVNPVYNVDRLTWSGNFDVVIPITSKLAFRSEFFAGENLSLFFGGINQGINPNTGDTIRSIGGWLELEYKWNSRWRSYCGWSIDDPINQDLSPGMRARNQSIYVNALYNITKDFEIGMEVNQWQTAYLGAPTPELTRLQWMARYKF
jgi:hypothetical protein